MLATQSVEIWVPLWLATPRPIIPALAADTQRVYFYSEQSSTGQASPIYPAASHTPENKLLIGTLQQSIVQATD